MENKTLVQKLNSQITELKADNKALTEKVRKYESIIEDTAKAKKNYETELKACRKLAAAYTEAVKEAQKTKRDLTEQMEKEIQDFRKQSKKILEG